MGIAEIMKDNTKPRLTWDGKTNNPNDYPNPAIFREYAKENDLDRKTEIKMLEDMYFPLSEMMCHTKKHCLDHTACEHLCRLIKSRIAELYGGEPQF
jgi:hypothetical protein